MTDKPDWRDPDMPVILRLRQPSGEIVIAEHPKETQAKISEWRFDHTMAPDWRKDPTYNLRRKKP